MFSADLGVGGTDHPAQNPPPLDGLARVAVRFYRRSVASRFVREHGLMSWCLDGLGLADTPTAGLFIEMLDIIESAAGGEMPMMGEE